MQLVDSHCHLDFREFDNERSQVLARARAAGVGHVLTIGTRVANFDRYRQIAEENSEVFFTIGTHPHGAAEEPDVPLDRLVHLSEHPKCVGIGESGLDFHYDFAPRKVQERVFRRHIAAARLSGLPLIIHAREADADMQRIILEEHRAGAFVAVLHCFSSGRALAEIGIGLGFYISFSGIVTFKHSQNLRAIARDMPLDRILVETDAPYLAPQSRRGKRNEPAFVAETAASLAGLFGMSLEEFAAATTRNFFALFGKAAAFIEFGSAARV